MPAPAAAPAADIFGSAATTTAAKTFEKRIQLKNIDTLAAKALDPWGISVLDEIDLGTLWTMVCKGDKYCKFFSEIAATSENSPDHVYRQGIGLSRLCEVLTHCLTHLQEATELRKMLKDAVLAKADFEAKILLPHLHRLNAGKASFTSKEETFGGLKRRKLTTGSAAGAKQPTTRELSDSTHALFDWLQKGVASNLRHVIVELSAGGVFFSAHVADKAGRAWLAHAEPKVTEEDLLKALEARHSAVASSSTSTSGREKFTGDLFD
jgi:hypothetical protein